MHPDGLLAAKARRIPGCCVFCEEPLPPAAPSRKPRSVICGAECWPAYRRAHRRDWRKKRSAP